MWILERKTRSLCEEIKKKNRKYTSYSPKNDLRHDN